MAKSGKSGGFKRSAPEKQVHPAWDKATWMSLSNVRLGVPAFIVAGALSAYPADAKLTEVDVRRSLEAFLNQSL